MTTDTAPQQVTDAPEFVEVDPASLILGVNVRSNVRLDRAFVSSIRERGVLEPIVAYRNDQGGLVVKYGQRRTLGAIEALRPTVPVVVVATADEADRVIDQYSENEHPHGTHGRREGGHLPAARSVRTQRRTDR
jgi:ParB family transcriptional regulator, chromosome partitioning protein